MANGSKGVDSRQPTQVQPGLNFIDEIGSAAGIVWRYLEQHGAVTLFQLKKDLELTGTQVERAIGWLAREGKVDEEHTGKKVLLAHK